MLIIVQDMPNIVNIHYIWQIVLYEGTIFQGLLYSQISCLKQLINVYDEYKR